jgi:hypothetical protein
VRTGIAEPHNVAARPLGGAATMARAWLLLATPYRVVLALLVWFMFLAFLTLVCGEHWICSWVSPSARIAGTVHSSMGPAYLLRSPGFGQMANATIYGGQAGS